MFKKIILAIVATVVIIYVGFVVYKNTAPVANVPGDTPQIVESYLRENISTLSPVSAVLGGTWYVVSLTIDPTTNSGTVVYEDGHIQEKRNFSYALNEKGAVTSLEVK